MKKMSLFFYLKTYCCISRTGSFNSGSWAACGYACTWCYGWEDFRHSSLHKRGKPLTRPPTHLRKIYVVAREEMKAFFPVRPSFPASWVRTCSGWTFSRLLTQRGHSKSKYYNDRLFLWLLKSVKTFRSSNCPQVTSESVQPSTVRRHGSPDPS